MDPMDSRMRMPPAGPNGPQNHPSAYHGPQNPHSLLSAQAAVHFSRPYLFQQTSRQLPLDRAGRGARRVPPPHVAALLGLEVGPAGVSKAFQYKPEPKCGAIGNDGTSPLELVTATRYGFGSSFWTFRAPDMVVGILLRDGALMRTVQADPTRSQTGSSPTDHYPVVMDCLSELLSKASLMKASLRKARMFFVRKTPPGPGAPAGSHMSGPVEREFNGEKMKFYEICCEDSYPDGFTYTSFSRLNRIAKTPVMYFENTGYHLTVEDGLSNGKLKKWW